MNHRMVEVGRCLWMSPDLIPYSGIVNWACCAVQLPLKFWVSPMKRQPLWEAFQCHIAVSVEKLFFSYINTEFPVFQFVPCLFSLDTTEQSLATFTLCLYFGYLCILIIPLLSLLFSRLNNPNSISPSYISIPNSVLLRGFSMNLSISMPCLFLKYDSYNYSFWHLVIK